MSDIFDAVIAYEKASQIKYVIKEKEDHIRELEKKLCGHCCLWMTTECKPEKEYGQFKSINTIACKDFSQDPFIRDLIIKVKEEISQLKGILI